MSDVEKISENFSDKSEEFRIDIYEIINLIKRNKKLIFLSGILGIVCSSYLALSTKRSWEGQFQIVLNEKSVNQTAATILGGFANLNATNELDTKVEILKSPSVLFDIFKFVEDQKVDGSKEQKGRFNKWKKNLNVKLTKGTTILNISYIDKKKEIIIPVLERLSEKYKTYSLDKNIVKMNNSIDFFDRQIELFKKKSLNSLKMAQEFGQKHDLLIFDGKSNFNDSLSKTNLEFGNQIGNIVLSPSSGDRLSSNYIEVIRVSAANKIRKIDEQLKLINNLGNDQYQLLYLGSNIPSFKDNQNITRLKTLDKLLVESRKVFKESDDKILKLVNEKKVILGLLKKELIGILKGERNISQATYEAASRPKGVIIKYQQLLKESARDDSTLNILETQKRQLELQKEKDFETAELITEPTLLSDPVGPNRKKILFFGTFIGLLIGGLLSKYIEFKKGFLLTNSEANKLFDRPSLDYFEESNNQNWNEKIDFLLYITLSKVKGEIALNVIGDIPDYTIEKFLEILNKKQNTLKLIRVNNLSENAKYPYFIFLTALNITKINEIKVIKNRLNFKENKFLGHIIFSV